MQSACHKHPILLVSTILDFSTPNLKATVISTFVVHLLGKFTGWLKSCWKSVVCSFVDFVHTVLKLCPTKSCATFFGSPYIYYILRFTKLQLYASYTLHQLTSSLTDDCLLNCILSINFIDFIKLILRNRPNQHKKETTR